MTTLKALNNSSRDYYWNKNPPTPGTNNRQLPKMNTPPTAGIK